ncbi:MAG: hypothetical protein C0513_07195 [Isosphaera sp.]|nr:hypothetical protein [Isosphaera sp.]
MAQPAGRGRRRARHAGRRRSRHRRRSAVTCPHLHAMTQEQTPTSRPGASAAAPPAGGASLGPALSGHLAAACRAHGMSLGPIEWFRSLWQRGGGSTGFVTLTGPDGAARPAVIKLPVGAREHRWTLALGTPPLWAPGSPAPRVLAAGESLNGYDLAWLVIERIPGDPIGASSDPADLASIVRAAVAWHSLAQDAFGPASDPAARAAAPHAPPPPDYPQLLEKARAVCKRGSVPDAQRWNNELKGVGKIIGALCNAWNSRAVNTWCHGDLHGGNALRRHDGACVLIDFALAHAGHWVEDALYLERSLWSLPAPSYNQAHASGPASRSQGRSQARTKPAFHDGRPASRPGPALPGRLRPAGQHPSVARRVDRPSDRGARGQRAVPGPGPVADRQAASDGREVSPGRGPRGGQGPPHSPPVARAPVGHRWAPCGLHSDELPTRRDGDPLWNCSIAGPCALCGGVGCGGRPLRTQTAQGRGYGSVREAQVAGR